jgi:hypothetical protein
MASPRCASPKSGPRRIVDARVADGHSTAGARRLSHDSWRFGSLYLWVENFSLSVLPCTISRRSLVVRIDAFAHRSDCSGCACDGGGLGGRTRWCRCNRPRSPAGIVKGCGDVGAVDRGGDRADHASTQTFAPSFGGWPPRTISGARRGSTASYLNSEWSSLNARCRGIRPTEVRLRRRRGVHFSPTTSSRWQRLPRRHQTRRAMPSTPLMHGSVSYRRSATGHASFIGGGCRVAAVIPTHISWRTCRSGSASPKTRAVEQGPAARRGPSH